MFSMKLSLALLAFVLLAIHVNSTYVAPRTPSDVVTLMPEDMYRPIHEYNMARLAEAKAEYEAEQAKKKTEEELREKRRNLLVGRYGFRIGKRDEDNKQYSEPRQHLSSTLKDSSEYDN